MTSLVLALTVFLGTHVALAEQPLRGFLVRVLGEKEGLRFVEGTKARSA